MFFLHTSNDGLIRHPLSKGREQTMNDWRPHDLGPHRPSARVILAVKNFAAIKGVCHIGLGVTASNTQRVLRRAGYYCEIIAAQTTAELRAKLEIEVLKMHKVPISHVIVSAPSWVQPDDFKSLALDYPDMQWLQLNHSGVAYLSIDKYGIRNIRDVMSLSLETNNVHVAGNNPRFVHWVEQTLGPCVHLPNLYDTSTFVNPYSGQKTWGNVLRVGCFGAARPWKNQLTAALSCVQLAKQLGVQLELFVNSKRPDGGERMIESRLELFDNMRDCRLIDVPWERWAQFRKTISTMHLLYQPSFDETFNVVCADGIAEGVACVTSEAIEWSPRNWWSDTCDPNNMTKIALQLLHDPRAIEDGRRHLINYTNNGLAMWERYLGQA